MSTTPRELLELARDARLRLQSLSLTEPAVRICADGLARMEQVLAKPPRIAIMGEVNSGKTSVADLLLGGGVLPASVTANTHVPVLIRYGDDTTLDAVTQQGPYRLTEDTVDELPSGLQLKRIEIGLPSEHLKDFELLDTPGDYVPGDDMPDAQIFLWCTVATRAWTESERARWSSLPPRCWHRGGLLATHKDALARAEDIGKVEQRLRRSTAGLFRDVLFIAAASSARRAPAAAALPPDPSIAALRQQVIAWAGEVSARRARKAERIIRHLARLTLHRLAPAPLSFEADAILKTWQRDSAKLLASVDSAASAPHVIRSLLIRFAQSMAEMRNGSGAPQRTSPSRERPVPAGGSRRSAAAHRYVGLIVADLTALLRINLAQWGLQDAARRADYAAARSILLPLANLDAVFDDLGQKLAGPTGGTASTAASKPPDQLRPPPLSPALLRTLGAG